MTKVFFACLNCRRKEIKRVNAIDEKANEGKGRFSKKQKTPLNPDNFIREASEVMMRKHTETKEYGKLTKYLHLDHETESIIPSSNDGWTMKCSECGQTTHFDRGWGNI